MYDDILLPTDGSDAVAEAAEHAATIAERFDATVHVLSVADTRNRFESPTAGISTDAWLQAESERADAAATETATLLPDDLPVDTATEEGIPRDVIVEYAEAADVDMIVMATHGRTGLQHYLIGSVTEKVVRRSPVPVVTVRSPD
jgi:nucleotide-binding universal stress UspA family protein